MSHTQCATPQNKTLVCLSFEGHKCLKRVTLTIAYSTAATKLKVVVVPQTQELDQNVFMQMSELTPQILT